MDDELVDVIDENDNLIGKELKSICHARGLWHRSISVFILNSKGQLLLQKRSSTMQLRPGLWCASCGGHLLSGDTYEKGAERELMEELGINAELEEIGRFKIISFHGKLTEREIYTFFIAKHDGPFNIDPDEIEKVEFFDLNKLAMMMKDKPELFTDAVKDEFHNFIEYKSKDVKNRCYVNYVR